MRLKFAHYLVISLFFILIAALLNLGIIQGHKFKELSKKNCIRLIAQIGSRGNILDRNKEVIVGNILSWDLTILPSLVEELDGALKGLAKILNTTLEDLKDKFRKGYVSPNVPVNLMINIDVRKAMAIEELKIEFPGVTIEPHPLRYYPHEALAAHVLGYLSEIDRWRLTRLSDYGYKKKDIVGFGGVEEMYDYYLRQEDGGLSVEVDRKGRFVRTIGFQAPQSGKNVQLTLDLKIQKIAEESLGTKRGCLVLMDPYNGEIIAMASNPDFSPSAFVKKSNQTLRSLMSDADAPLFNRAISGAYPAGSLFKVIVAAAALETGKINLSTTFLCNGGITIGRRQFACWDTHGSQNLIGAITHSCNVFFYKTGLLLGPQTIRDYALRFGLSKLTGIDLPQESLGFVPQSLWDKISHAKSWFDGDTANFSIGQGLLLVTPIQMVRTIAVFANGGKLVRPHILKAIDGQEVESSEKSAIPLSLKESTVGNIRKGLREVASAQGTAGALSSLPIAVAGKTGTAQVTGSQPHGWFIGFFPFKKPKFALCVFLERGGSGYNASLVAKALIEAMVGEGLI